MPILKSEAQQRLITALVDIARALQIEVVAEGVETYAHADLLQVPRIDVSQGYAFGRREPREVIALRLTSQAMLTRKFPCRDFGLGCRSLPPKRGTTSRL